MLAMNVDAHVEFADNAFYLHDKLECGVLGNFVVDFTINLHVERANLAVPVEALRNVDLHDVVRHSAVAFVYIYVVHENDRRVYLINRQL